MQPPIPIANKLTSMRKALHILKTAMMPGDEILVYFSDGSAAIFEAEELEKLRPSPKQLIPSPVPDAPPLYANAS